MQTLRHLLLASTIILNVCFWEANPASAQWSQTTATINYWYGIASSADGSKLVAAADEDSLYQSSDSGATWYNSGPGAFWTGVASSADGTRLYGATGTVDANDNPIYGIYVSHDSGNTWTLTGSSATNAWYKVACSADGKRAVGVCWWGPVFVTSDCGSNWTEVTDVPTNGIWEGCACSADGRVMAAISFAQPTGVIGISTNYGVNWSFNNNAPQNRYWTGIACSANGKQMVAVADAGPYQAATLFTSSDWGNTWSSANDAPLNDWGGVACSADGKQMVAVSGDWYNFQQIYLSTNSGANWVATDAPSNDWCGVTCSADGGKMYAVVGRHDITGPIYGAQVVVSPKLRIAPAVNGAAAISWTVPSTNFVLQQSPSLASPSWTTVTNVPVMTNVEDQVVVPSTNSQGFFQLQSE